MSAPSCPKCKKTLNTHHHCSLCNNITTTPPPNNTCTNCGTQTTQNYNCTKCKTIYTQNPNQPQQTTIEIEEHNIIPLNLENLQAQIDQLKDKNSILGLILGILSVIFGLSGLIGVFYDRTNIGLIIVGALLFFISFYIASDAPPKKLKYDD